MRAVGVVVIAAVMTMVGFGDPASASAAGTCMHDFGTRQHVVDPPGSGGQEWTVTNLTKSTDPVPGYPLAGQLWEATASVTAVDTTVTPLIPNFRTVTADGGSYRVLWQLATPQGISGATLAQGQTSTGKLYFDATGADPVMVTYTGGGAQPMMWCDCQAMMAMSMPNSAA